MSADGGVPDLAETLEAGWWPGESPRPHTGWSRRRRQEPELLDVWRQQIDDAGNGLPEVLVDVGRSVTVAADEGAVDPEPTMRLLASRAAATGRIRLRDAQLALMTSLLDYEPAPLPPWPDEAEQAQTRLEVLTAAVTSPMAGHRVEVLRSAARALAADPGQPTTAWSALHEAAVAAGVPNDEAAQVLADVLEVSL